MRESRGVYETPRRSESKLGVIPFFSLPTSGGGGRGRNTGPPALVPAESERTRWYPKDGELCLSRLKPEETLVEDRSASDVQIDRLTRV